MKRAEGIVRSYETPVTLRQLFYRLVAAELLPNTTNAYTSLSRYAAEARRAGTFPALIDRGRAIHKPAQVKGRDVVVLHATEDVGAMTGAPEQLDRVTQRAGMFLCQQRGLHYLVAGRQPERNAWLEEFEKDERTRGGRTSCRSPHRGIPFRKTARAGQAAARTAGARHQNDRRCQMARTSQ